MKEPTPSIQNPRFNECLRQLLNDPNGAYQRWQRKEAPYYEMCGAVVLAYRGLSAKPVFLPFASAMKMKENA